MSAQTHNDPHSNIHPHTYPPPSLPAELPLRSSLKPATRLQYECSSKPPPDPYTARFLVMVARAPTWGVHFCIGGVEDMFTVSIVKEKKQ